MAQTDDLKILEEQFKDRYTENDIDYSLSLNKDELMPPVLTDWVQAGQRRGYGRDDNFEDRNRKRNYRGNDSWDRRNRDDSYGNDKRYRNDGYNSWGHSSGRRDRYDDRNHRDSRRNY